MPQDEPTPTDATIVAAAADPAPRRENPWRRLIALIGDLGEVAKLVALILAILGLIAVYFPGVRRSWDQWANPSGWYWIGTVGGNGRFSPNAYEHPLWSNAKRAVGLDDVLGIAPGIVITGSGTQPTDSLHVGRAGPHARDEVRFVLPPNVCLYVIRLEPVKSPNTAETFVWAEGKKVTC